MNEIVFFAHIVSLLGFLLLAVRMGKEALIAAFSILLVTANLFVVKQVSLFGLHVTAADVYAIGSIFALSCLQEYYGRKVARQAIWVGFFSLLVVGVMSAKKQAPWRFASLLPHSSPSSSTPFYLASRPSTAPSTPLQKLLSLAFRLKRFAYS